MWNDALSKCNLLSSFPNLIHDISYSSPIGYPPSLSSIFLPHNLSSAALYPDLIDKELETEVHTHCMSGPFTITKAISIFGSPFCSSPVGLVEKVTSNGIWRMIRHLSKHNSNGDSTNGWIDSDKFP